MSKKVIASLLATLVLVSVHLAHAQQAKVYRVGVIHEGGPYIIDAMVVSQAQFIIDTARAKKLPTMFGEQGLVALGALVGYGVSYDEVGRLSAKYVQRILSGASPQNLPVEMLSKVGLAVNLKTARELGLAIPQAVRLRADKVIQ